MSTSLTESFIIGWLLESSQFSMFLGVGDSDYASEKSSNSRKESYWNNRSESYVVVFSMTDSFWRNSSPNGHILKFRHNVEIVQEKLLLAISHVWWLNPSCSWHFQIYFVRKCIWSLISCKTCSNLAFLWEVAVRVCRQLCITL